MSDIFTAILLLAGAFYIWREWHTPYRFTTWIGIGLYGTVFILWVFDLWWRFLR